VARRRFQPTGISAADEPLEAASARRCWSCPKKSRLGKFGRLVPFHVRSIDTSQHPARLVSEHAVVTIKIDHTAARRALHS
jgi:hypothetical protein